MNTLAIALWIYGLSIVFALFIALLLWGADLVMKRFRFADTENTVDLSMPTSISLREEELTAVAMAAAYARRNKR